MLYIVNYDHAMQEQAPPQAPPSSPQEDAFIHEGYEPFENGILSRRRFPFAGPWHWVCPWWYTPKESVSYVTHIESPTAEAKLDEEDSWERLVASTQASMAQRDTESHSLTDRHTCQSPRASTAMGTIRGVGTTESVVRRIAESREVRPR